VLFNFLHHLSGPIPGQHAMRRATAKIWLAGASFLFAPIGPKLETRNQTSICPGGHMNSQGPVVRGPENPQVAR